MTLDELIAWYEARMFAHWAITSGDFDSEELKISCLTLNTLKKYASAKKKLDYITERIKNVEDDALGGYATRDPYDIDKYINFCTALDLRRWAELTLEELEAIE